MNEFVSGKGSGVTKPRAMRRFWQTSARCAVAMVGLAALTAVSYRLNFRSALLCLMVVVLVALAGDFLVSAIVSFVAFLCLTYFLSPTSFLLGLRYPLNLVSLVGFLMTAFVVSRLVSKQRTGFQEIQALKEQLGLVIDSMPAVSSVSLPDGSLEFVNHRWLEYTGLQREEAQGSGWKSVVHPDDRAAFTEAGRTACARKEPMEVEARIRRADGGYRWFLVRAAPMRDAQGNIIRWYSVSADIEDRKVAEALLAGEKRLLEMMATGRAPVVALRAP